MVGAKYQHQLQTALGLGADIAVVPGQLARAVRREAKSLVLAGRLTAGADVVFDCVGTSDSITQALAMCRPRGRVVLVGMPGNVSLDLAPLWHRELTLVGAYAYGVESTPATVPEHTGRTFELATDLVGTAGLGSLVSATYPLQRYKEALAHAGAAGRRGAVKVAFDLRNRKGNR
jgi:threonine dehydrogenase-like Zn-dependent dehydrogenase